ncbi:hypothetical protein TNCV_2149011 [Trichonephila clavipes]|nr:hypothetical protein TNCV_2149011 [Trichonephila clavipes]
MQKTGFQSLNDDEIVTSEQEESDPVDDKTVADAPQICRGSMSSHWHGVQDWRGGVPAQMSSSIDCNSKLPGSSTIAFLLLPQSATRGNIKFFILLKRNNKNL